MLIIVVYYFRLLRKNAIQAREITRIENERLKSDLDIKNIELEYKSKELSKALANIVANHEVLVEIKRMVAKGEQSSIKDIVNNNIGNSRQWNEFELSFESMYPEFIPKLTSIHPKLTENELKLCSLLFIQLKSKDIAAVLNISEASVDKARQRLRKSLGLDSGSNLSDYLKSINK